jgi:TP901 family phage tail tape measure protein
VIDAGTIAAKLVLSTNPFTSALDAAKRQLSDFADNSKQVGQRLSALGGSMETVGKTATLALSLPIAGIGTASVKAAADFEQGMSNIKAVSGATGNEMQLLRGLALQMGKDTSFSAGEAAKGIEELIKAGVSTTDILNGGLGGALSLAAAGELDLGSAAEIASTALNAFKGDNLTVARAADILAGAANASATSVEEMKYGLSSVAAVAASAGKEVKSG